MAYTPENETDAGPGPACCGTATWTSGANHRGRLPLGFVPRRDGTPRPALRADDGDLDRAVDAAWGALRGSNEPPGTWLFRRGGRLVCLLPGDDGPPSAIPLGVDLMRLMLAQVATWRRRDQRGRLVAAAAPYGIARADLALADGAVPVLAGVAGTPMFGPDGALRTEPGYHPETGWFYAPPAGFSVPDVPERPSARQVASARDVVTDDLFADFPFAGEADLAHAVALLIQLSMPGMIRGPRPLFLVEKPTPRTGGTLLLATIARVATGRSAAAMVEGQGEADWAKRITAVLRAAPALVMIDNVRGRLDSAALAAVLTATAWEDRILGTSTVERLPVACAFAATANNPVYSTEIAGRVVRIRLDAGVERPDAPRAGGFRHPDLLQWVCDDRPRLVAAVLTLIRAWVAAGMPAGDSGRVLAGFEGWSRAVGGVLATAGIDGFLGNVEDARRHADEEAADLRAFMDEWWRGFRAAAVGVGDLYPLAPAGDAGAPTEPESERAGRTRFGRWLFRLRGRVFALADGLTVRVEAAGTYQGAQRWRLAPAERRMPGARNGGTASAVEPVDGTGGELREPFGKHVLQGATSSALDTRRSRSPRSSGSRSSPPALLSPPALDRPPAATPAGHAGAGPTAPVPPDGPWAPPRRNGERSAARPGTGAILALDLADHTGWALATPDGRIQSGVRSFKRPRRETGGMRYVRFREWLAGVARAAGENGISRVVFEEVRRHAGTDAAHVYGGYLGVLLAWGEETGIPCEGVPVGEIKKFATGRGNADKDAMVDAARRRGFAPIDDNEADALWLLLLAIQKQG